MPRPLSTTVTDPSALMAMSIFVQYPARASSTELSTTSYTRWCRPLGPVDPMYMLGRLRTASSPSRTWMSLPEYELCATEGSSLSRGRARGCSAGALRPQDAVGTRPIVPRPLVFERRFCACRAMCAPLSGFADLQTLAPLQVGPHGPYGRLAQRRRLDAPREVLYLRELVRGHRDRLHDVRRVRLFHARPLLSPSVLLGY